MSLMNLLSVSSTFSDGRNKADDYKIRSDLPNFSGKRRAGRAKKPLAKRSYQPSLFDQKVGVTRGAEDRGQKPERAGQGGMIGPSQIQKAALRAARKRTWLTELREFFFGRRRVQTLPSAQTERALSEVKVVRNDLCDADLEVVSKKAPASPDGQAAFRSRREMAGLAWTRLTARFFHSSEETTKKPTVMQQPADTGEEVQRIALPALPLQRRSPGLRAVADIPWCPAPQQDGENVKEEPAMELVGQI